jgi:hypothetical protein
MRGLPPNCKKNIAYLKAAATRSKEPAGRRRYGRAVKDGMRHEVSLCGALRLRVKKHKAQITSYKLRVFLLVGLFVFDVALGVGVDGILVGIG